MRNSQHERSLWHRDCLVRKGFRPTLWTSEVFGNVPVYDMIDTMIDGFPDVKC